ncbi:hypothetical protein BESB_026240 [Besnoitia besnoiti]|uniref:Uncharacterized protein n=1 Tax=Besnoitia besnoiti TaxID=94643 RepID=A0A2A9M8D8_BESBE|nr:uncharacterized protein BESB_026240 [Besnoitia besnoiti]PFH31650.1 hypothetical protein BESB_026240 [Besnoitia besnoiti]
MRRSKTSRLGRSPLCSARSSMSESSSSSSSSSSCSSSSFSSSCASLPSSTLPGSSSPPSRSRLSCSQCRRRPAAARAECFRAAPLFRGLLPSVRRLASSPRCFLIGALAAMLLVALAAAGTRLAPESRAARADAEAPIRPSEEPDVLAHGCSPSEASCAPEAAAAGGWRKEEGAGSRATCASARESSASARESSASARESSASARESSASARKSSASARESSASACESSASACESSASACESSASARELPRSLGAEKGAGDARGRAGDRAEEAEASLESGRVGRQGFISSGSRHADSPEAGDPGEEEPGEGEEEPDALLAERVVLCDDLTEARDACDAHPRCMYIAAADVEGEAQKGACILDLEVMKQQVKDDCMMLPRGTLLGMARDLQKAELLRMGPSLVSFLRTRGDTSLLCRAVTRAYFSVPYIQLHALRRDSQARQQAAGEAEVKAGAASPDADGGEGGRASLEGLLRTLSARPWKSLEPWEKLVRALH